MRAIWKGNVSFGLVAIAVNMYAATEDKDIRFHQVHRSDGGRIRYRKVCELEEKEVPAREIVKSYKLRSGESVLLEQEDFDSLPLSSAHSIDVLEFVPADQIDPIRYAKAYYLEPERSTKPYTLLRDALADSSVVAIVKVALRQREQLATLRTREDVLVLNTMLWPDEVRSPAFDSLNESIKVSKQEMAMAKSLIESMTAEELDLSKYHDDYREALQKVIDAKAAGEETVPAAEPEDSGGEVIDLMAALEESMKRTKGAGSKSAKKKTARKSTGRSKKAA